MRILIISHTYVSKYHQEKIEALAKYQDLEIFLMVPEFGIEGGGRKVFLEKRKSDNYKIIPIKTYFSGKWNSYLIKGFKKYLNRIKPDIVHLEEEYWTNVAWQVKRGLQKMPNTKLILFTWENIYHDWRAKKGNLYQKNRFKLFNKIEKKVLKNVDLIIAGNKEATQVLKKKKYGGAVELLPQFGVNDRYFTKKNVGKLKKELNPENCFVVGYIGRVNEEKGIESLIRAVAIIKQKRKLYPQKKVKLLVIGNGNYKQEGIELSASLSVEDSIVFLDAVDFNQIVDYYNIMDLMVIPSLTTEEWKEQFGRTIIEAMSCGVPVIGSSSGAIPEVIGEAGVIFQEGKAQILSEKINHLAEDDKLRNTLIDKGLKRIKENFTTEIIAKKTYEIYRKLAADRPIK